MRYECGPEWDTRIITINPKHLKVGILMSGGIDSWVLFNIIKQVIPEIIIFNIKELINMMELKELNY